MMDTEALLKVSERSKNMIRITKSRSRVKLSKTTSCVGVAFLQGLADGDGYASIRSFNAGIATLTNHTFLNELLNTFNIFPTVEKSKVRIGRYDDIVNASKLPLFKHAKRRQEQLEELSKLIGLLDRSYGKVPREEIDIIMEMHGRGMTCGEITESLWVNHGIARSRRSVEGIIKRRK
jgi:hypothetical protein